MRLVNRELIWCHKSPKLRPCPLLICVATHTFWTPSLALDCAATGETNHISLARTQGPLDERLQEASCWGNVPRTSKGPAVQGGLRRARGEEGPTSSPIWLTGCGGHLCLPQGVAGLAQCLCRAFIKQQLPGPLSLCYPVSWPRAQPMCGLLCVEGGIG